jgi:transcriptional regulator with GAF, ATPase, and Fis domain
MNESVKTQESQELSLERRIKMHEARDGIISRLSRDLPTNIDLERFLNVIVSEIGRMMNVDRCDLLQLSHGSELRISHEWRASDDIPTSAGTTIPIEATRLAEHFDLTQPIRVDDISKAKDPTVRFFGNALGTHSLLVIPIMLNGKVFGLLGLHDVKAPRVWLDEEVDFLQSIAREIATGYQYTRLYVTQEQETKRTNALLEIANILNSHSDFGEVSAKVLERAIELVGADYGALGVLDQSGKRISLATFKSSPDVKPLAVLQMIEEHNQSLDIEPFPALTDILNSGKTLNIVDTQLPFAIRLIFNSQLNGKAALVSPVKVAGQSFGLLGFVFSEERQEVFEAHEVALVEGIADQIGTALERDQLTAEVMRLKSELHQREEGSKIIGQAAGIRRAIELGLNVADTQTTVLIQGASGTGKELLANLIHYNSDRKAQAYVKINCGAIPETLLESELFGHEKGAFTDARSRRIGRFEEADGGTLFLDEIGEMTMSAQVKLLRVLQDGELNRVGSNEVVKTDVRVITASNVDLEQAVEAGKFRQDLFYRLSVFPITLPSLSERAEDIHLLVLHFLELYKEKTKRFVSGISKQAMSALVNYEWPGNVRQLENAIERAVIIASGRQIEAEDLPEAISKKALEDFAETRQERLRASSEGRSVALSIEVPSTIDEIERMAIEATLEYADGDKTRASKLLGIGRKTLYRKLDEYSGKI